MSPNRIYPWKRHSVRLKDYDYTTPGAYFVTACTYEHRCLFGKVVDGGMRLNAVGRMIQAVWDELAVHYPNVETDAFVVLPNHIHGINVLVGAAPRGRPKGMGQAQGPAPTQEI